MGLVKKSYGLSDIGISRSTNEDHWIALEEYSFFAIADGMGGHKAGEVAAKEAMENLSNTIAIDLHPHRQRFSIEEVTFLLRMAIETANRHVFDLGRDHHAYKGMGTTLCCLYFHKKTAIFAHVGDSRLYLLRKKRLSLLTEDHSLLTQLGQCPKEKGFLPHPYKNIITKAIGTLPIVEPTIAHEKVQKGDLFLLTTDGLTDFITEEEIETSLATLPIKESTAQLISRAKEKGSRDNITTLAIKLLDG